ncbi:MAG: HEAT repeat domain-containing protein, partial [Armatimonadetes bacterium]|nr:HEAT repeat domain-containing protein [Armatimonadota bacterium]
MEWQGMEIELQVPCTGNKWHPVRLRITGWGEYEVIHNPCVELLGEALARTAPCTYYLQKREWWKRDDDLRRRVVEALAQAGSSAVPALIQALGDDWESVRAAACGALAKIGDARAVSALSVWAAVGDKAAREALQSLGQSPLPLEKAVRAVLASGDWGVVQRALGHDVVREVVVKQMGAQAVPYLIQALRDEHSGIREAACEALGQIGDARAIPALIQKLGDEYAGVRAGVCRALGRIGDVQAVPALIQKLRDGKWQVREAACEALGQIGDARAVPALIQALGDKHSGVRQAACEALAKIGDARAVPALSVWAAVGDKAAREALQSLGQSPL